MVRRLSKTRHVHDVIIECDFDKLNYNQLNGVIFDLK
jgi:hypothetical protein